MLNAADRRDECVLRSRRLASTGLALSIAAGLDLGSVAQGKKVPRGAAATQVVFDQQKPAIVDCVMEHGIKLGIPSGKPEIKVLVNRSGQNFGTELKVTPIGGNQNAMSDCVKKTLDLTHFLPNRSVLTELRRVWTFSAAP